MASSKLLGQLVDSCDRVSTAATHATYAKKLAKVEQCTGIGCKGSDNAWIVGVLMFVRDDKELERFWDLTRRFQRWGQRRSRACHVLKIIGIRHSTLAHLPETAIMIRQTCVKRERSRLAEIQHILSPLSFKILLSYCLGPNICLSTNYTPLRK